MEKRCSRWVSSENRNLVSQSGFHLCCCKCVTVKAVMKWLVPVRWTNAKLLIWNGSRKHWFLFKVYHRDLNRANLGDRKPLVLRRGHVTKRSAAFRIRQNVNMSVSCGCWTEQFCLLFSTLVWWQQEGAAAPRIAHRVGFIMNEYAGIKACVFTVCLHACLLRGTVCVCLWQRVNAMWCNLRKVSAQLVLLVINARTCNWSAVP